MNSAIYTIGYGNRRIEDFINLLQNYKIDYLIDVRSKPFSRFNPNFRKKSLELHLINNDIRYLFLGTELGGMPTDPECYINDKVDYQKVQSKSFFQDGIEVIREFQQNGIRIALMCAELSPVHCHRKKLIGNYLETLNIEVIHIDKDGTILNELF